jgi:hypothetical protein
VLEALEARDLLSGLAFRFTIDDPGRQFAPFPLLAKDLDAAGQVLSGLLDGRGTIQVVVRPNNSIPRSEGTTLGTVPVRNAAGALVYESAALAEAQTGVDPSGTGPEIELDLNTQDYLPQAWFDPSGAARTGSVPAGKSDFLSVVLHEMTHGLAFQGYRATDGPGYGTFPGGVQSAFDGLTGFGTGAQASNLFFRGPLATAVYGGPVPLTSVGPNSPLAGQNFYHLGNPAGGPGANLTGDIMNGMVFGYGTRYSLARLDLAILADVGWAARGFPAPAPPLFSPPPAPPAVAAHPALVPPAPSLPPLPARPRRHRPHRHRHPAARRAELTGAAARYSVRRTQY